MDSLQETWVYLSATPLFNLTLTLVAYQASAWVFEKSGRKPILNPVLGAVAIIVTVLLFSGTDYNTYFQGAQFVHFLLGPATVALAVPLYRQWDRVRRSAVAITVSLVTGSVVAALSAIAAAWIAGGSREIIATVAPKSVTTPVAMAISEQLGGLPSLTAVVVIVTGIFGAMFGSSILNAARVRGPGARGLAMGTACHGIGTARALDVGETAGAFSGLAMGLNALATAFLLPILWGLLF